MWPKFFVLFFLVAILGMLSSAQEEGRKCVDGKSYYDGCNWCSCSGPQGVVACTLKLCYKQLDDGTMVPMDPIPPPEDFYQAD